MAEAAPKYGRGTLVYIRESAALGFLEQYTVQSITYTADNQILYRVCQNRGGPNITTTFGDRYRHRVQPPIDFREQDLITYCDALELVKLALSIQLTKVNAMLPGTGCS